MKDKADKIEKLLLAHCLFGLLEIFDRFTRMISGFEMKSIYGQFNHFYRNHYQHAGNRFNFGLLHPANYCQKTGRDN